MGRRQWHAVEEVFELNVKEGLPRRTRALNLEVPMEMRKRIAKAHIKLNNVKKNDENANRLKAFARKNDENDKHDEHPPRQVPRRPGGARSHTKNDEKKDPDRARRALMNRIEKLQRKNNAAVINKHWPLGWWERDHDGWWVYRVPCDFDGFLHIVDYYWYGKSKWWSPTENKEDAPWDRERGVASSSR